MKPRHYLTDSQVLEVWADNRQITDIALAYGCSKAAVYGIKSGHRRNYITGGRNTAGHKPGCNPNSNNFGKIWSDPLATNSMKAKQSEGAFKRWRK